jgi:hypothetical protein
MEETVGPVCTFGRGLLRGWWRLICLVVSFMIFTASVRNIVDNTTYLRSAGRRQCKLQVCHHAAWRCLVVYVSGLPDWQLPCCVLNSCVLCWVQ